jgi:hypothetical protein
MLPLRLQSQSYTLDRRILVAIHREPTLRAGMDTIRKCLFDDHATSGTHLRRISGVHQNHLRASLFRFALGDRDELIPGDIGNAFCQMRVLLHVCDIQILKYNCTKPIHHLSGSLVSKIEPSVGDPFMDVCDVRRSSGPSSVREFLSLPSRVFSAPSQGLSHRCGRTGGFQSSPRLRGWRRTQDRHRSRPRYLSVAQVLDHTRPRNRHTHFSVEDRRIVRVLIVPSTGRWRMIFTSPIFERWRRSPLSLNPPS